MKAIKENILVAIMTVLSISTLYAQTYEYQKPIQPSENYKGTIARTYYGGMVCYDKKGTRVYNTYEALSNEELYTRLLNEAKAEYGNQIILRQFKSNRQEHLEVDDEKCYTYDFVVSAAVCVSTPPTPVPTVQSSKPKVQKDPLTQAITKALQDIKEGSRLALDVVRIANGDKEDFKDQIVEILLDEGYKVVAKDYLEKLYQEQQDQQSGIYNDRTTVQENNFSAVGYYINVRKTETAIKVQVINVSTGEYEANVTINVD